MMESGIYESSRGVVIFFLNLPVVDDITSCQQRYAIIGCKRSYLGCERTIGSATGNGRSAEVISEFQRLAETKPNYRLRQPVELNAANSLATVLKSDLYLSPLSGGFPSEK